MKQKAEEEGENIKKRNKNVEDYYQYKRGMGFGPKYKWFGPKLHSWPFMTNSHKNY